MTSIERNDIGEVRIWFFFSQKILHKVITIVIISTLIAIAYQTIVPKSSAQYEQKVLTYGTSEPLDTANPYLTEIDIGYIFAAWIYDNLMFPDKDMIQTPNIASSWWKMDGDTAATLDEPTDFTNTENFPQNNTPSDWLLGSIWEYNITKHIYWSDGTLLTAEDVVWTTNLQIGANFMIYWAFQPEMTWIHHAEKVNDYKVRIFFAERLTKNPFPITFGDYQHWWIMPKHFFQDQPTTYLALVWDGAPTVGSGPFMGTPNLRQEVITKEFVTLVKNPYYDFVDPADGIRKGLGGVYNRTIEVDKIILKMFSDRSTLHLGVRTGQVDTSIIEASTYLTWLDDPTLPEQLKLQSVYPCTGYTKAFCFNAYKDAPGTISPLRLDPAVQRAGNLATNRSFILESVFKGLGETGRTIIATPAWPKWYWDPGDELSYFSVLDGDGNERLNVSRPLNEAMEYDVDLANQILNEAGYIWEGEEGNSRRKATSLVGERLQRLGIIANPDVVVDKPLEFEMIIPISDAEDRLIGKYIEEEWKKVGIFTTSELVDDATWVQILYSYTFDMQFTYWSGDYDPNYLCYITTSMSMFGWNDFGIAEPEYDQLFYNQAKAQNYQERKYWVDECSKWQYLYGSMIVHTYPKVCYAYRTDTWKNWGNWSEHIGLCIEHFWGEPPIFFEIKYEPDTDNGDGGPEIPLITFVLAGVIAAIAAGSVVYLLVKKKKKKQSLIEEAIEEEREL